MVMKLFGTVFSDLKSLLIKAAIVSAIVPIYSAVLAVLLILLLIPLGIISLLIGGLGVAIDIAAILISLLMLTLVIAVGRMSTIKNLKFGDLVVFFAAIGIIGTILQSLLEGLITSVIPELAGLPIPIFLTFTAPLTIAGIINAFVVIGLVEITALKVLKIK